MSAKNGTTPYEVMWGNTRVSDEPKTLSIKSSRANAIKELKAVEKHSDLPWTNLFIRMTTRNGKYRVLHKYSVVRKAR